MFSRLVNTVWGSKIHDFDNFSQLREHPIQWSRDLERHDNGEFSMAAIQANDVMEDYSQVETGSDALFIAIYDGHGGFITSRFLSTFFFPRLLSSIQQNIQQNNGNMSSDILRQVFSDAEKQFMSIVARGYHLNPTLGIVGSCCLIGLIWKGILHIANLGDSRAIVASEIGDTTLLKADQLTKDHNCSNERIRMEIEATHPDSNIVLKTRKGWRIKGFIQVSRTIGDAYLKLRPFQSPAIFPKLGEVPQPFTQAVLSAKPEIRSRVISKDDKCLIFASHGFWKIMTNEEAVLKIERSPRRGIARRLVSTALEKVAKEKNISYRTLQAVANGRGRHGRRAYHDDITVIVVFLDQKQQRQTPQMSYRAFSETVETSEFTSLALP